MPYVFVGDGQPIPGIGYGPMTEKEYRERVDAYEAQFVDGKGSVAAAKLYKRVSEEAAEEIVEEAAAPAKESE
jgi:diketogulonate reductase-like aldo/keto reductase